MYLGASDPYSMLLLVAAVCCLDDKLDDVTGLDLLCVLNLQSRQAGCCWAVHNLLMSSISKTSTLFCKAFEQELLLYDCSTTHLVLKC